MGRSRYLIFQAVPSARKVFSVIFLFALVGCSSAPFASRQELFGQFSKDEKKGNLVKAKEDLSSILKTHPSDPIVWNDLAYLDFLSHHYRKAQGDLSQGLAMNPLDSFLLLNKSRILLAQGKNREARSTLLSMMSSHPWPKGFRLMLAIADSRTGHMESARLLFEEILAQRPSDTLASIYLSRLNHQASPRKALTNG